MIFHDEPFFHLYLGDRSDNMHPREYLSWKNSGLIKKPQISPIADRFAIKDLYFLRQVHGTAGVVANSKQLENIKSFSTPGDFLITDQPRIALGVMTGDCLPVVCFDKQRRVLGIAHAGWRGAVAGVVPEMIRVMQADWQSSLSNLSFFFGPSAQRCCYEVSADFQTKLEDCFWWEQVLHQQGDAWFFDLSLFVQLQLADFSIQPTAINRTYNSCTICDDRFYSHRRATQAGTAQQEGRQMTIVALK